MRIQLHKTLPSSVPDTFAFLSDPSNRPLWQRSLSRVELLTDGAPKVGTRWREWPLLLGEVSMEITEFEGNLLWAERGLSRQGRLDLKLGFAADGNGTKVSVDAHLELPKLLRWAAPFARPLVAAEISGDLLRAAAAITNDSTARGFSSGRL